MKKKVAIFLFNGYSDWEIAYLTPEIAKSATYEVVYFSVDGSPVRSMGGLQVHPSMALGDVKADELAMLILPGGAAWEKGENTAIAPLVAAMNSGNKYIAAICAATAYLASCGLLDSIRHTSNDLSYLKAVVPSYAGDACYCSTLAVTDANIITACGIAPVEFAREIFAALSLHDGKAIEQWYQLFKNGIWSE